tara:strand:+ start:1175 stop:1531 length:357 start_codon:yes stop_codon:yes gene_type:complete
MKLIKKIYKSEDTDNNIDRTFSELKNEKETNIDINTFFETYHKIFFQIPKTGNSSHTTLLSKSGQYAGSALDKSRQIQELNSKIIELTSVLSNLQSENNTLKTANSLLEGKVDDLNIQ